MTTWRPSNATHWISLVVSIIFFLGGCSRGSHGTPSQQRSDMSESLGKPPHSATENSVGDGGHYLTHQKSVGIRGIVKVLEGSPTKSRVVVTLPETTRALGKARVDGDGRFQVSDLEAETYRVILPADGFHATAEVYVTIGPDAGLADVEIPRSHGCPVTIIVRDHNNHLMLGVEIEMRLTDLPQVSEPHTIRGVTNENGQLLVIGSCVRGFFEGTLTVPGRGIFPFRHGYVGTGRDRFDIVLPDESDAGVTYANDD